MCFVKGDFPRKHRFTGACLLFCVSFLFAQEEATPQALNWQQTLRNSVTAWTYQQVSDYYLKYSNTPHADLLYEQAKQVYLEIISNRPDSEAAFCARQYLLFLQIQSRHYTDAERTLSQLQTDFSDYPLFADCLRVAADMYYYYTDRTSMARELYQKALGKVTGDATMYVQRGLTMANIRLEDYTAAESEIGLLLSEYPNHPEIAVAVKEIANAYLYYTKDPYKARNLYTWILQNKPDSSEAMAAQRGLALTAIDLGDMKQADEVVEDLLLKYSGHPKISFAIREVADRYFYSGNDPSRACNLYERILTDWPDSPETMNAQRGLAMAKVKMDDIPAAYTETDKLLSDYKGHPELAEKIANVLHEYWLAGKTAEAIALSNKILSGNPDSSMALAAYTGLAQAYAHLGEDARVVEIIERILRDYRQEEQCGYSVFVIGEAYYRQGVEAFQINNFVDAANNYIKAEMIWQKNLLLEDQKYKDYAMMYGPAALFEAKQCYEKLEKMGFVTVQDVDYITAEVNKIILDEYPDSPLAEIALCEMIFSMLTSTTE